MPTRVDLFLNLGWRHLDQGDYDFAINASTRAIELEPDNAHAYDLRGVARGKKDEY